MKTRWRVALICLLAFAAAAAAQIARSLEFQPVPELGYRVVPDFFEVSPGAGFGEASGVALNSKGHIFVYTRSGETRLFEFDSKGQFLREIGDGLYGF